MASILIVTSKAKAVAKEAGLSLGAEALQELSSRVESAIQRAAEVAKAEKKQIIKAAHIADALQSGAQ